MSFLGSLFSNKGKDEFTLVVDVGSESIGAAFVQTKKNNIRVILGTARHVIPFQEKINMERFITLLQSTLESVLNDNNISKIKFRPNSIIFTLASPWYKSQTRVVHIEENEEFIITESGLNTILEKEKNSFLNKGNENIDKNKELTEVSIESYITQIKVGGYEVENAIGRKTKNIDISIHIATSESTITKSLSSTVEKKWPGVKTMFHSFMFSAFSAVRDIFEKTPSYVLIDIAGEITDISLIRDDVIIESISFPLGYRSYLRATMRQLSLQSDLASSEIDLFFKKELSPERLERIESVFSKTTHDWALLFVASLKQLSQKYPISRNIYLLTNEDYSSHFEKAIKESSIDIFGENQETFRMNILDSKNLSSVVLANNADCKDLFLCVTIIMLDKLLSIENKHN